MPVQGYIDQLNERERQRQEQARLRNQAASWRRWMRLPSPAATPLNPAGRFYEQVRLTDSTALRPGNFFNRLPRYLERQQRRAARIQPPARPIVPALQQVAQGFAPTRASERQEIAFGVTSPEEYQRGITEEGARRAVEFGESLPTQQAREQVVDLRDRLARAGSTPEILLAQLAAGTGGRLPPVAMRPPGLPEPPENLVSVEGWGGGVIPGRGNPPLTQEFMPGLGQYVGEKVPGPLGPPLGRLVAGVGTPLGAATLPIGGVTGVGGRALAGGILGQLAAGAAGEAAGVPPWAQMGLEVGGGLLGGVAGALRRPRMGPRPARVPPVPEEAVPPAVSQVSPPPVREVPAAEMRVPAAEPGARPLPPSEAAPKQPFQAKVLELDTGRVRTVHIEAANQRFAHKEATKYGQVVDIRPAGMLRASQAATEAAALREYLSVPVAPRPAGPVALPADLGPTTDAFGAGRRLIRVRLNQIETRPELFQTRDVTVSAEGIGQSRVDQLVKGFDPGRFTPPKLVENPEQPGRFIVQAGHHRLAAARRVLGADAEIPAVLVEGDIRDPSFLARMRLEAAASNFSRAEMNIREQARTVTLLAESGMEVSEIGQRLRMATSHVEDLQDMMRLGEQALDRVVTEPTLGPIAAEIGRGVRLFGLDQENALALFARFAQPDPQGRLITRTALRETIKRFAPKLKGISLPGFEGLEGFERGGILGLLDEVARQRSVLDAERRSLKMAMTGAERLGARTGQAKAASSLVAAGRKEVRAVEARIKALEDDLTTQLGRSGSGTVLASSPKISERVGPGRIQRVPLQTSERALSPSLTTRAITPPTETGPVITSGLPSMAGGSSRPIIQQLNDADQLFAAARKNAPELDDLLRGEPGYTGASIKDQGPRFYRKLVDREPNQVSDYLRGRVITDDPEALIAKLPKNRILLDQVHFHANTGYRGRHLQIRMADGNSAEVALVSRRTAAVQEAAHPFYEALDSADASAETFARAQAAMRHLYENAPDLALDRVLAAQRAHVIPETEQLYAEAQRIFRGEGAFGKAPPPQFGSQQRQFMGEQGALQPRMFTPEEAGQRGQLALEDRLAPEAAGGAARPAEELVPGVTADDSLPPERLRALGGGSAEQPPPTGMGAAEAATTERTLGETLIDLPAQAPKERRRIWAEYDGAMNLNRRQALEEHASVMDDIRGIARDRSDPTARQMALDVLHLGGEGRRTPLTEQLFLAVHSESPIDQLPLAWQPVAGRLKLLIAQEEAQTVSRFPQFAKRLIEKYFPRFWKPRPRVSKAIKGQRNALAQREFGATWDNLTPDQQSKLIDMDARLAGTEYRPSTGPRGPGTKPRFTRGREYDTFAEGLAAGEEPASWNPVRLYVMRRMQGMQWRAQEDVADFFKNTRRAVPADVAEPGWQVPEVPAFQSRPFVNADGTTSYSAALATSPEDATMLRHMFPPAQAGTDPIEVAREVASAFKRMKVGIFALQQHIDLSTRAGAFALHNRSPSMFAVLGDALFNAFRPGGRRTLSQRILADPDLRLIEAKGGQFGGGQEIRGVVRGMSDEALRFPVLGDVPVPKQLRAPQRMLNGIANYWQGSLFEGVHTGISTGMSKRIFNVLVKQGMSRDDAAFETGKIMNLFMSNIPDYQSVITNPKVRDLLRATIFSVNENEAWFMQPIRAVIGPNRGLAAGQLAALYVQALAMAELINFAFTGEALSLDQLTPVVMDGKKPQFNTRFLRPALAGDGPLGKVYSLRGPLGRTLYLDLLGQADTPLRFLLSPELAVRSRLSTPVSALWDLARGETFFGERKLDVRTPGGIKTLAEEVALPMAAGGFVGEERERIGLPGGIIQAGGYNVSAERLSELAERRFREQTGHDYDPDSQRDSDLFNQIRSALYDEAGIEPESPKQIAQELSFETFPAKHKAEQAVDDRALLRFFSGQEGMEPEKWQDSRSDRSTFYAGKREGALEAGGVEFKDKEGGDDITRAKNRYYEVDIERYRDTQTREVDWDAYGKAQDRALRGLSPADRRYALDSIHKNETPVVRAMREARESVERDMDAYYDITGRGSSTGREAFRRDPRHARLDAVLWILGTGTTSVLTRKAQAIAEEILRDMGVRNPDVPLRGGGGMGLPSLPAIGVPRLPVLR